MLNFNNKFHQGDDENKDENEQESIFPVRIYEETNHFLTIGSTGEDRFFIKPKENNNLLNNKRENDTKKKKQKQHNKFSSDNLKRECKHLAIENLMKFINEKIRIAYNGNIGQGIFKKELFKLNQRQKKNSSAAFNQVFLYMTLKEILSQKITKKIKFYDEDHNKNVINTIISEKKEEFENLFNLTFVECIEHFAGTKQIEELNGLTLFSELKEQIVKKYKEDGESYYQNLEFFLKEFEKRINNAKPRKNNCEIMKNV